MPDPLDRRQRVHAGGLEQEVARPRRRAPAHHDDRGVEHVHEPADPLSQARPHLGDAGRGILEGFEALHDRTRRVRVACGDWTRVLGPSVTWRHGTTAVFLDPPYGDHIHYSDEPDCIGNGAKILIPAPPPRPG